MHALKTKSESKKFIRIQKGRRASIKTKHHSKNDSKYLYLGCSQDIKDYLTQFFIRTITTLSTNSSNSKPLPITLPLLPSINACTRCKNIFPNEYNQWCSPCETLFFQQKFRTWSSGNGQVDEFIRKTQLTCFKSPTTINGEFEGPQPLLRFIPYAEYSNVSLIGQGGFSKVYRATWSQNILFGTLKWWTNEMEKQNSETLYKIIYEEASDNFKQNGIDVKKNLGHDDLKKYKSFKKITKKFGHSKSKHNLKSWYDRFISRVDNEITQGHIIIPDEQYTGTTPQYVALKQLINSQDISGPDFVRELQTYFRCMNSGRIPQLYGISRDKETNDFILVTQYTSGGNLRQHIHENFINMDWWRKVAILFDIAKSIKSIHIHGFVHHDFHSGNVLIDIDPNIPGMIKQQEQNEMISTFKHDVLVSDLGISIPATEFSSPCQKKQYGIIPYIAPEVLQGGECSRPSEIYSFAIVMWELMSGKLAFQSVPHDQKLVEKICSGMRPEITKDAPRFYSDLMERCWDPIPAKRPDIDEIVKIIGNWRRPRVTDPELFNKAEKIRTLMIKEKGQKSNKIHKQAKYYSRLLDFEKNQS
ncbi:hypothetical protein Glove_541g49 [Diversispora epigaea]|uniref:Protein kinase domain-containing protein n=1 Tax=Diversispora epigaea TaxID=1348612 RepID=A0A397GIF1_9GLOM|nr:hypothetical protein Glove_541g49 [Diversispora epigaea]